MTQYEILQYCTNYYFNTLLDYKEYSVQDVMKATGIGFATYYRIRNHETVNVRILQDVCKSVGLELVLGVAKCRNIDDIWNKKVSYQLVD
jgi:DNA-binding Xre family transcriptional regulator